MKYLLLLFNGFLLKAKHYSMYSVFLLISVLRVKLVRDNYFYILYEMLAMHEMPLPSANIIICEATGT
jgi:hypothetical protein